MAGAEPQLITDASLAGVLVELRAFSIKALARMQQSASAYRRCGFEAGTHGQAIALRRGGRFRTVD